MSEPTPTRPKPSDAPFWIAGGLVIAVLAIFGQTIRHDFLFYDDGDYITNNAMVLRGLTWEGLRWSLTAVVGNLWHPLTLMSHMLDVQLFGLRPGLHHFVNVLLHAANAVLVFTVLRRMTGDLRKPALVAALFALHPLRAESVAWASERKDVLSALFFLLGLWAYARYVETRRVRDYALVAVSFALGLCAKPMLVTFPFVLLLLDFWPLRRVIVPGAAEGRRRFRALLFEKAPLFAMAAAAAGVAAWSQSSTGATGSLDAFPIRARLANAVVAYGVYLRQTIAPLDLAVMYPHPGTAIAWAPVIGYGALLGCVTLGVLFLWDRLPFAFTGWLWFLGMLVPVIGLVQVGNTAHADRYTYLPHVGLLVAIVWSCEAAVERLHIPRRITGITACAVVIVLAAVCYVQVHYWRNTITLFERTVAVSPNSAQANFNLCAGYALNGRPDLAEPYCRESLRFYPQGMGAKANLAAALIQLNRPAEAEAFFRELIEQDAYKIEYHYQLAAALFEQGKYADALFSATEALRIDPTYHEALVLADRCRRAPTSELRVGK